MNYIIYQLDFFHGVRFGSGELSGTENSFRADTLFAALYQEALKLQEEKSFLEQVKNGELLFSDGFPYIGNQLFLPKPLLKVNKKEKDQKGDSKEKKRIKNMKYIPLECIETYRTGMMTQEEMEMGNYLGKQGMKVSVGIMGNEEPEPYRVSAYYFHDGNGLYLIVGYASEENRQLFEKLLNSLSYTGLGGKKSAGFGRFEYRERTLPKEMEQRLKNPGKEKLLLSTAMAKEDVLEKALEGATYTLLRRGGFVASETYAEQQTRKRERYVFAAGSCFQNTFSGEVVEERNGGKHPIYRYEKAVFLGVDI